MMSFQCRSSLLLFVSTVVLTAAQDCDVGYSEYNNECYKVNTVGHPQMQAFRNCRAVGGDLVSIHSQQQNDFIYNLLLQNNVKVTAWIGLKTDSSSQTYWTDGTGPDYSNLAYNSTVPSSCYAMSDVDLLYPRQWVAEDCVKQSMPYVCKKLKKCQSTTTSPLHTTTATSNKCGLTQYFGQSGSIRSPNYPFQYQGSSCSYQVNGSSNAVNIQIPAMSNTRYYEINIYEGAVADVDKKIFKISSNDTAVPISYSSPTAYMLVTFYAADLSNGMPFIMTFNSTEDPVFSTGNLGKITPAPFTVQPVSTNGPITQCPNNWNYDVKRKICIQLITPFNSFMDSQSLCASSGANLLSIHSQMEENDAMAILKSAYHMGDFEVWLGGEFNGKWGWTDNTPFGYIDWINGNNPGIGNCLAAVYRSPFDSNPADGWMAQDCSVKLPALCYKQPNF